MEKIYNKLVRDNIPDIILKDGEIPVTRILSDNEYRIELYKKLFEECNELVSAKTSDEIIEEASDVFEVLGAISKLEGSNVNNLIETANEKRSKRGGFIKKIFLVKSIKKD